MSADAICDLDLKGLSEAIGSRAVSSEEATKAYLSRIERYNAVLNAYITVATDTALAQSRVADQQLRRGARRGPIHGIPLALKDIIACAGMRMTAGSRLLSDYIPDQDACVTERLYGAGAIVLGKLSLYEFAFGRPVTSGEFPTGRNPWDVSRDSTGSSSGSGIAVAAGFCAGALGSDTGGSIRNPSARCGIVGIKPTYGLVSRRGVIPLSWSLDHIGPMARTVWDTAAILQAIAGRDPADPSTRDAPNPPPNYTDSIEAGVKGVKLGLLRRYYVDWPGLHEDERTGALAAFEKLEQLGAQIQDEDCPTLDLTMSIWVPFLAEAYEYHERTLRERPQDYGNGLRTRLSMGALFSGHDLVRAQRLRARLRAEILDILKRVDALIFPGQAAPAHRFEEFSTDEVMPVALRYTMPWNLVGLPAIVIPCGFSRDGLPISIQIVGRPFEESTILRIARAYERCTEWHRQRPDPARWRLQ